MSELRPLAQSEQELDDQLSLAALDWLSPADLATLPPALVQEVREAVALLGALVEPVAPPPGLRERLLRRVSNHAELTPASEVRSFDGGWRATGVDGIAYKRLYHDQKSGLYTSLLRMERGARYPRHLHHDDEQCLVIEGDVRWGEVSYHQGDFVASKAGTVHETLETESGNVLLIISGHNEFIDQPA